MKLHLITICELKLGLCWAYVGTYVQWFGETIIGCILHMNTLTLIYPPYFYCIHTWGICLIEEIGHIYIPEDVCNKECIPWAWEWNPKSLSHFLTPRFERGNIKKKIWRGVTLWMVIVPKWPRVGKLGVKMANSKSLHSCLKSKMWGSKHPNWHGEELEFWMLTVPKWLRHRRPSWRLRNSHGKLTRSKRFVCLFYVEDEIFLKEISLLEVVGGVPWR